jgi:hypothetical protein
MRYTQEVEVDGDDLLITVKEYRGPRVLTRRWQGAAKYIAGYRSPNQGPKHIVLSLPVKAGINIRKEQP